MQSSLIRAIWRKKWAEHHLTWWIGRKLPYRITSSTFLRSVVFAYLGRILQYLIIWKIIQYMKYAEISPCCFSLQNILFLLKSETRAFWQDFVLRPSQKFYDMVHLIFSPTFFLDTTLSEINPGNDLTNINICAVVRFL